MKQSKLTVKTREGSGRRASRRLRGQGRVPAILYGKTNASKSFSVDAKELGTLLKKIAGSAAVLEIVDDAGDSHLSILQEVQRNPITDEILHVDLHEVAANEKITLDVPVHSVGEPVGVKLENGLLEVVAHTVSIRCLPINIPSHIEVDVSALHTGSTIHIRELPIPAGVEYLDDPDQPVISCVSQAVGDATEPVSETSDSTTG